MTESRRPKDKDTHIGNHKLDPSTLMMGYGFDPALSEGSLKPPIFLTSTFVFQTAAEGKRFFEGITNKHGSGGKAEGLVYSRFNGPNQEILEDRLKIWEDAEAARHVIGRGKQAISSASVRSIRAGVRKRCGNRGNRSGWRTSGIGSRGEARTAGDSRPAWRSRAGSIKQGSVVAACDAPGAWGARHSCHLVEANSHSAF